MKKATISPLLALFLYVLISLFPNTVYAEEETTEQTLLSYSDFESDNYQGWNAFGNKSVISITNNTSYYGIVERSCNEYR